MTHLPTLFKFRASESCIWFGTASVTPFKEEGGGRGKKKKTCVDATEVAQEVAEPSFSKRRDAKGEIVGTSQTSEGQVQTKRLEN